MITRKEKEAFVNSIAEDLKEAELLIVTDYRGLNVAAISSLRGKLREENCSYKVTKNTLTRLACRKVGLEELEQFLDGPTAIAYSSDDPVSAAKVFLEFSKDNEALNIKGGLLSGQILEPQDIKALGEIPPREVLLAKVCGGFQAPISGLVNALQGNIRQLVYALDAVRQQKETA